MTATQTGEGERLHLADADDGGGHQGGCRHGGEQGGLIWRALRASVALEVKLGMTGEFIGADVICFGVWLTA